MSQKPLSEIVKLVLQDFESDGNQTRLLRRLHMIQINLNKTKRLIDATNIGQLKNILLKRKGSVKKNGRR